MASKGEIILDDKHEDVANYSQWGTDQLKGRVRTIQALAGRISAKKINQAFVDELADAKFDRNKYQTTTIINLNDELFGTGFVINHKAVSAKKKFWWSSFVLDENGSVAKTWGLKPESSAIIITDRQGKILFAKDGELTPEERAQALNIIKTEIAKAE